MLFYQLITQNDNNDKEMLSAGNMLSADNI
jgi:hypothetical protein